MDPDLARSLRRAGINVLTLANNHVVDCGRAGVLETFDALADAGIDWIGAGTHEQAAHTAAIPAGGPVPVGSARLLLEPALRCNGDPSGCRDGNCGSARGRYLWTTRPGGPNRGYVPLGCAIQARAAQRKIGRRPVSPWKCGADAVIGHHAHIIQPFEIYRGIPIFYSVGNFAFGTLNSRAEGLLVALRFEDTRTVVHAYPLYVKNRDPRVAHQPKALRGAAAEHALRRLREISGVTGASMDIEGGRGTLSVDREAHYSATAPSS